MGKIVIEIVSSGYQPRGLHVFNETLVRLGRGFSNDLILLDPFVSSQHVCVEMTPEGQIHVIDQQSENGVFLAAGEKVHEAVAIPSGGIFIVGTTKIRVFRPDHPVAPTATHKQPVQPMEVAAKSPVVFTKMSLWYALTGIFILYFFEMASVYPYVPMAFGQILFMEVVMVIGIVVWAGIWAILGRLIRHQSSFITHFILTCVFSMVTSFILHMSGFAGFVFASPLVEYALVGLFAGAAFGALLYGHLTYATALSRKAKLVSAIIVPLIPIVLTIAGGFAFMNEFSPQPRYYNRLKPPLLKPVRVAQPEEFITHIGTVFESLRAEDKD